MCHQIVSRLVFPIYGISVRPQGNGTTTDIILQSKMILPKVALRRSEAVLQEKKHIILMEVKAEHIKASFHRFPSQGKKQASEELKVCSVALNGIQISCIISIDKQVLLDEESNIIIDDEETKRQKRRSKMLQRRTALVMGMPDPFNNDDLNELTSFKETTEIVC